MAENGELLLLDLKVSPFAARVRIALAEKGLKYESNEEDLSNKTPLLLQMNPVHKQIPVLIHNGKPICESMNIVQYIDEVWNNKAPLLPSHPYQRAHARFWADYIDKKFYPNARMLGTTRGEVREASKKELKEMLKIMEGEIGDRPYFAGESFGCVDLAFIPFSNYFYTFEKLGGIKMEIEFPKLVQWAKRCLKNKESVSKSLPYDELQTYQIVLGMMKNLGIE